MDNRTKSYLYKYGNIGLNKVKLAALPKRFKDTAT